MYKGKPYFFPSQSLRFFIISYAFLDKSAALSAPSRARKSAVAIMLYYYSIIDLLLCSLLPSLPGADQAPFRMRPPFYLLIDIIYKKKATLFPFGKRVAFSP